jgi:class 3 adenylate cyclase
LKAADSRIDLVISDWMMPRMSGPELVKAMKAEHRLKSIPIILLTAKGDEEARSEATAYGANAYLSKPFDEGDLVSTVKNLFTLKQKEKELADMQRYLTEQVLQRYLPTKLVERIIQGTMQLDEAPRMEVVTIMFADICGFTSTTEALGSRKTAEILNTFLTEMTEVIFRHGGTIDKFIGDCILVIFGAPEKQPSQDQVIQARNCSLAMFRKLAEINEQWLAKHLPPLKMRIGIHHGSALVGNFGGPQRSDYTAIGHTVNLASRVQSAADEDTILISQVVRDLLPDDEWEDAGSYKVKGVASEQRLYRVKKDGLGKVA